MKLLRKKKEKNIIFFYNHSTAVSPHTARSLYVFFAEFLAVGPVVTKF